jgi:Arc/MetJ-type ribon-helix-helix transcriptional regulator
MGTMNISLPDSLKAFVDEQVSQRGYGTSREYVRELIRRVSAPAFIDPQPSRRAGAPPE